MRVRCWASRAPLLLRSVSRWFHHPPEDPWRRRREEEEGGWQRRESVERAAAAAAESVRRSAVELAAPSEGSRAPSPGLTHPDTDRAAPRTVAGAPAPLRGHEGEQPVAREQPVTHADPFMRCWCVRVCVSASRAFCSMRDKQPPPILPLPKKGRRDAALHL